MVHGTGPDLFVGVDGGGSRCRVRVRDADGTLLAETASGAANVYLDADTALATIRSCVRAALDQVAGRSGTPVSLGLGLAGVSSAAVAARVAAGLADVGSVIVRSDGEAACVGAHDGDDGGLIVAGTGSAGFARVGGRAIAVGGRGFILGDDGSGARLGLAAWRRALRAHDGFEPHTGLTRALMAEHGDDPVAVIGWGRTARSADFARYVPMVFYWAEQDDPMAFNLVLETGAALAELGAALVRLGAPRLALVGGLAAPVRPYLPDDIRALLREPIRDALDGALILAGCPFGPDRTGGGA